MRAAGVNDAAGFREPYRRRGILSYSLSPLKKNFYVRLSQPAHPEVGGATDKDITTELPPPHPTTDEEIQAEVANLPHG